ncbi:MAG: peptide chain release factor 1 [Chlamydiales bacterium]
MEKKIEKLLKRLEIVEDALGRSETLQDKKNYKSLTQEYSYLSQIKSTWADLQRSKKDLKENQELFKEEADEDFILMLEQEIKHIEAQIELNEVKIKALLVPPNPHDHSNTILELRAGTGGDEAALFVGDCVRMYKLYADSMGWKYEQLSCTPSEVGGFKEYVVVFSGENVNRFLRHEGGTHRVQRVPETEAQGRVHTSAITVAVLLEPTEEEEFPIDEKDLRIDTYRASGAGGQHVNTTDSAVRITHIPTGTVAYCQEERSQHKNKAKALRLLKAKLSEAKIREIEQQRSSSRSKQIGTGDRSERIRTYNFPQNRVTDHRINLTLYNLDRLMQGEMQLITEPLLQLDIEDEA